MMATTLERIKDQFGWEPDESGFLFVPKDQVVEFARFLKETLGFSYLSFITCVDYKEHLDLVYLMRNPESAEELLFKVRVTPDDAVVPSLTETYQGAEWHEREVYDLFGVRFDGHPDLRRILLPDEYEGHPLRKDFPMDAPFPPYR